MHSLKEIILSQTSRRILGLARATFFGYITYEIGRYGLDNNSLRIPAVALGSMFTLDGLADLISGEWHYLFGKTSEYFNNRRQKNAS